MGSQIRKTKFDGLAVPPILKKDTITAMTTSKVLMAVFVIRFCLHYPTRKLCYMYIIEEVSPQTEVLCRCKCKNTIDREK